MKNIVVATVKSWNFSNFLKLQDRFANKFNLVLISNKDELTFEKLNILKPDYIFFPHWSWIIPKKIYSNYNCIVFHITDLPFGRGGSPFQNLILRKIYKTKISAIKVDDGLDTGDVFLKEDFDISNGSVEENLFQASNVIFKKLIPKFLDFNLVPHKQKGKIVKFKRRKPSESNLVNFNAEELIDLYDFIRMLDGEGYPNAFLDIHKFKIKFFEAHMKSDKLVGKFEIEKK